MTKIFFDTEFTGLHQKTTLISIGFISECGKYFYAELNDYDKSQIDEWLQKHVIDNLIMSAPPEGEDEYYSAAREEGNEIGNDLYKSYSVQLRCDKARLKVELEKWLSQFEKIEIWSDCLPYDWVLFCEIFGGAFGIPKNIFYIPFDLCTLLKEKGVDPDISREKFAFGEGTSDIVATKHNALWDAMTIKSCHHKLTNI
jgi:hypothetical protein